MELKDIQINILTKTMADLLRENAELKAALIILQRKEVPDGSDKDSAVNESVNAQ